MGVNCMFLMLPAKFKRQFIKYKHTALIVKACFGKNNFALSTYQTYLMTVYSSSLLPTLQFFF